VTGAAHRRDVAIVRMEQLYPVPEEQLRAVLEPYPAGTPVMWTQEEPANMGALVYLEHRLGRELFGKLVPWNNTWTPSADSAAIFSTSADIDVAGSRLRAGRYALWMIPGPETWTVIFSTHQPVFHLNRPEPIDEVLRVRTKSHPGDHVESLAFYLPMVDADSAVLVMHWGRTVVPIPIKVR
jgi:hypothetical protein